MMKGIPLFILLLASLFAKAQTADTATLIGLHPAVGKVIDRDEKMKYHLFPEYDDRLFDKAQFYSRNDTAFMLVITSISGTKMKYAVNPVLMDELYEQIDAVDSKQYKDGDYASNAKEHPEQVHTSHRALRKEYIGPMIVDLVFISLGLLGHAKL